MQVTETIRQSIHDKVVETLNMHAKDEDVDRHLTLAFVGFLKELDMLTSMKNGFVLVQYKGHRQYYEDVLYGSGVWRKNQVKSVPFDVAEKMMRHADVYIEADDDLAEEAIEMDRQESDKELSDESEELQSVRDSIQNMTRKKAVIDFVDENFPGMKLDVTEKNTLAEYKKAAILLVDLYRTPETI